MRQVTSLGDSEETMVELVPSLCVWLVSRVPIRAACARCSVSVCVRGTRSCRAGGRGNGSRSSSGGNAVCGVAQPVVTHGTLALRGGL